MERVCVTYKSYIEKIVNKEFPTMRFIVRPRPIVFKGSNFKYIPLYRQLQKYF